MGAVVAAAESGSGAADSAAASLREKKAGDAQKPHRRPDEKVPWGSRG